MRCTGAILRDIEHINSYGGGWVGLKMDEEKLTGVKAGGQVVGIEVFVSSLLVLCHVYTVLS